MGHTCKASSVQWKISRMRSSNRPRVSGDTEPLGLPCPWKHIRVRPTGMRAWLADVLLARRRVESPPRLASPRPQACRPSALSGASFGPAGPFEPPMDSLRETSGSSRADRRTCRTARGERPGGRTGGTRGHGRSAGCPIPAGHMAFRQVAGIRRSTISAHQEQPAGIASSLKLYAGLCTAAVSPLPTRM